MIPQEKAEAVSRGLRTAFGVSTFEEISRITRGHTSSLVVRIIVRGSPYLLKIITRQEDPTRHYASMKAAAQAGIAPPVWYADIEHKISITGFVEAEPLPISEALLRLPALLRRLHALPRFEKAPFNTTCTYLLRKGAASDPFLERFRNTSQLPKAEIEEFFERLAQLAAIYPNDDDGAMAACHNDLFKPDNILFDGQLVWLVDWEAAFLNDRYADLAVVANQVVANDQEEFVYLQEYFGMASDEYQMARFHLMQQIAHLFYTMAFLTLGSQPDKAADWNAAVPDFREYHRRIWAGEVDLADKDVKIVYGRVHWERFLHNVRQPRYKEALRIVSHRQQKG